LQPLQCHFISTGNTQTSRTIGQFSFNGYWRSSVTNLFHSFITTQLTRFIFSQSGKRSQYFWADTTQHFVSKLPPDGKIALDTTVCFSRPGIYNVNRYKFSLKDDKGKTYQQIYAPFQHIIIVEAKNEIIQSPKI
jgi:hypothetical protein